LLQSAPQALLAVKQSPPSASLAHWSHVSAAPVVLPVDDVVPPTLVVPPAPVEPPLEPLVDPFVPLPLPLVDPFVPLAPPTGRVGPVHHATTATCAAVQSLQLAHENELPSLVRRRHASPSTHSWNPPAWQLSGDSHVSPACTLPCSGLGRVQAAATHKIHQARRLMQRD
jgi:hypothetical protein